MPQRKLRSIRKKAELPSFLLNMTAVPENIDFTPRDSKSKQHLGPIFFGECQQFYPPLHKLELGSFRHVQHSHTIKETIEHLFLTKTEVEKRRTATKVFHPLNKRKKFYLDPYSHKCPGARKAFLPEVRSPEIDLGKTTSVIEGETSMEISLCRLKRVSSKSSVTEFELISPSDLREEKLKDLPYKKRIAHPHFPKRFATLIVIGPTIPAAITITKLPTKRKIPTEMKLLLQSQEAEGTEQAGEYKEKNEEVVSEAEPGVNLSVEEEMKDPSEYSSMEEDIETDIVEEDNDLEEVSEEGISAETEEAIETMQELKEQETVGVDITDMDEKSEENQEEEEENLKEDY